MLDFLVVGGIAFGLAYWIAGTGTPLWRSIVGALLGFIIGWIGGTAIFAFILYAGDFGLNSFDKVIGRNFWFALAGAGYGVHRARKKLRDNPMAGAPTMERIEGTEEAAKPEEIPPPFVDTTPEPPPRNGAVVAPKVFTHRKENENSEAKHPPAKSPTGLGARVPQVLPVGSVPDEAFAEAMAEIEESRTVKGLWARCYAETGGDEQQTKVAYLSKRAEVLAAEFNRRLFLEAQANRRSKELSTLMAGVDANDPNAVFKLGMLFRTQNELVQTDEARALACITKAAFLWHAEAQNQLSMMYWNGDGVPQSKCDALAWCRCAGVNDATYWKRVTQWMTLIDSPEVTESDEIVASIVAVKDNPQNLEGAIAAFKTRNLLLASKQRP